MKAGPPGVSTTERPLDEQSATTESTPMDDTTCERPESESFWLWNGLFLLFPAPGNDSDPEPEPSAAQQDASRSLVALVPKIEQHLALYGVRKSEREEFVQTVLVKIWPWWQKNHSICGPEGVAYVLGTAKNVLRGHTRHEKARGGQHACLERAALTEPLSARSAEDEVIAAEIEAERVAAVGLDALGALLPPERFRAVYAFYFLCLTAAEIARCEGAPVPTVYNRLRLAREDIRAAILRERAKLKR
ncbi:MAG: sigma factor-like helix-turn-helix DNA-binding protein [Polyangiaceae bacterium]